MLVASLVLQAGAAAHTVTDKKGRQVNVVTPFTRIISLYGAHTENLFHLGCEELLVGVSVNDTYPENVKQKPSFSYHDGPEKFIGARPDLILIRPMIDNGYPKLIQRLEKSGIVVLSLQPSDVDEMYAYWITLGELTGRSSRARPMVSEFKEKISKLAALTKSVEPKKRVYFEAIHSRMKTFSKGAMPLFALETAGGINVARDAVPSRNTNIANYGKERILAKASQIDLFLAQKGVMNNLILSGIIIAAILSAGISFLKFIANEQVAVIIFWLMGSFASKTWADVMVILLFLAAGTAISLFFARDLNLISLGGKSANSLGVDIKKVTMILLVTGSMLAAICVSVSGIIGFVGLLIPHMIRFLTGPDNGKLIPLSLLTGAALLLMADTVTRAVLPHEIPIGVLTALTGGPVFCWIFRRNRMK